MLAFRTGLIRVAWKATESGSRPPWVISPCTIFPGTDCTVPLPLLKKGILSVPQADIIKVGPIFHAFLP